MAQGREEANMESKAVRESLEPAGLVVNKERVAGSAVRR